jgi:hypothetical protein
MSREIERRKKEFESILREFVMRQNLPVVDDWHYL